MVPALEFWGDQVGCEGRGGVCRFGMLVGAVVGGGSFGNYLSCGCPPPRLHLDRFVLGIVVLMGSELIRR